MSNPFATEDAWEVSTGDLIPVGDFVCSIESVATGRSGGNYPQIELEVKTGDNRTRKDWLVITPNTIGKVVQLLKACGAGTPPDEVVREDYAIEESWLRKNVLGKRVGVIVREEEKYNDPGKFVPKIRGYVEPDRINASDVTSAGEAAGFGSAQDSSDAGERKVPNAQDDTIPF
jgi:hypothetical protein